jgi:hypothetical protein
MMQAEEQLSDEDKKYRPKMVHFRMDPYPPRTQAPFFYTRDELEQKCKQALQYISDIHVNNIQCVRQRDGGILMIVGSPSQIFFSTWKNRMRLAFGITIDKSEQAHKPRKFNPESIVYEVSIEVTCKKKRNKKVRARLA